MNPISLGSNFLGSLKNLGIGPTGPTVSGATSGGSLYAPLAVGGSNGVPVTVVVAGIAVWWLFFRKGK